MPRQEIFITCYANDGHRSLGQLCLQLLDLLGGVVDLGGPILPPVAWEDRTGIAPPGGAVAWDHPVLAITKAEIRDFVAPLPGRCHEVGYQVGTEPGEPSRTWFTHVVDRIFLAHWLEHPHFHMVK